MSNAYILSENGDGFISQIQNSPQYYKYATQSNTAPSGISIKRIDDADSSNLDTANTIESAGGLFNSVTLVGTNGQPSPYGAYDMAGNAEETLEDIVQTNTSTTPISFFCVVAGGSCARSVKISSKTSLFNNSRIVNITWIESFRGFRIASSANPLNYSSFVDVGSPNNTPDINGLGSVAYSFKIGQTEITNQQYVQFLNAIAKIDTYGIFSASTTATVTNGFITRTGSSGNYVYAINNASYNNNRPVVSVSHLSACRFVNWLSNNRPTGSQSQSTTENGAYSITVTNGVATRSSRNTTNPNTGTSPTYWIPNKNEWYKAAYHSGTVNGRYYEYPNKKDTPPLPIPKLLYHNKTQVADGDVGPYGNYANYVAGSSPPNRITAVGTNGGPSAFGTYDQTGQVWEWIERAFNLGGEWSTGRMLRGGSYYWTLGWQGSNFSFAYRPNLSGDPNVGFRIAGDLDSNNEFMETVLVYDTSNANDPASGRGAVNYEYKIGKYVVTCKQYTDFLNSVRRQIVLPSGFDIGVRGTGGLIVANGNYSYSQQSIALRKTPVAGTNFFDAVRFVNWLHNGRPNTGIADNSTTENGAYGVSYGSIQSISRVGSIATVSSVNLHPNLSVGDQIFIFGSTVTSGINNFNNASGITVLSVGVNQFTINAINSGALSATGGSFWATSSVRKQGAKYWIPNENEWYKAAYYNPGYKYKTV